MIQYEHCFVKSFGWYKNNETIFIAMEYLKHGGLHTYLNRNPPLPEPHSRDIAVQVVEGLHYMHQHDFAHRDLKPGVSPPILYFKGVLLT